MRLPWRRPAPCPSSWACVAEPTPPRLVVWLGDVKELARTAWCPLVVPGQPARRSVPWRSCHGDSWCVHCGRQLPSLSPGAAVDAVAELRVLLERVQRITPIGTDFAREWRRRFTDEFAARNVTARDVFRTINPY